LLLYVCTGVSQGFNAVRYHSLAVERPTTDTTADSISSSSSSSSTTDDNAAVWSPQGALVATAWSSDGVIMGIKHSSLPHWGLQFHPESIGTESGSTLIKNFRYLKNFTLQSAAVYLIILNVLVLHTAYMHVYTNLEVTEVAHLFKIAVRQLHCSALFTQCTVGSVYLP
jgi:Glutamine amidotransferase class-I